MIFLLSVTIKIVVLTLGALAATAVLRRRSAAVRHWVLATALFGCLCIPALDLFMPVWTIPLPAGWSVASADSSLRLVSKPSAAPAAVGETNADVASLAQLDGLPSLATVLAPAWIGGVVVGVAILCAGLWRLRTLTAESEPVSAGPWRDLTDAIAGRYGIRRDVRLRCCRHATMLATWGVLHPTILLPEGAQQWSHDRIHAVLHHELAHVLRGDWLVALTANLLRAVYWFNPLMWIACGRLRHEGERACDDLVLRSGISGSEYAAHLLDVARECAQRRAPWSPAIAIAHHSTLEGRVRAMLAARVNRDPLSAFVRATTVAVLASVTVSIGIVTVSGHSEIALTPDARFTPSGTLPAPSPEPEGRIAEPTATPATASAVQAQAAGGTIEGVLYDQFGGLLPGVSVKLTHVGDGSSRDTLSDRGGSFAFHGLATGDYELVTDLPGFLPVKNVVRADSGATARRHITLPIGTVTETIHVTCTTSDLDSSRPAAPTAAATPGPAQRRAATAQRGVEPQIPATFTGGIGGQIKAPTKLSHTQPVCPAGVTAQSSVVRLAGRIGIDGLFSDLHNTSSDAAPGYVASAMEAARKWVFTPTLLNNAPIEVNISVTVSYSWN